MQLDGFPLLRLVPDGHEIWNRAQERLAGQVIPAADAEHRSQPQRARAQVVVELRRAEIDERRDQHDVWLLLLVERLEFPTPGHRLLELSQHP